MMTRKRILVIDDEESMCYFLTRSLTRAGFSVEAAESGEQGLDLARDRDYDLYLVDLRLPGKDGLEVLKELREFHPEARVVMMTGFGTVERALQAMRLGAADFIAKPFRTAEIEEKVQEALGAASPESPDAPEPAVAPEPDHTPDPPRREPGAPPPRTLAAFLLEAARDRDLDAEEAGSGDLPLRSATRIFETLYFLELLERTGGNVSLAARIAGISRPNLHRRIHDLSIDVGSFRKSR